MRARLAALACLLAAATSQAHLRFPSVRAERWIELRLDEDPIRIGYRLGFGAELAKQRRKSADRDADGEVSAAEGNAALDAQTAELLRHLKVCTGREPSELDCSELRPKDVELVEAEGWIPGPSGHLHFAWTLRLKRAATDLGAIRVVDAWQTPEIEITDVAIQPARERGLTTAGEGERPEGVRSGFTWIEARRGDGPRVITASWAPPAARRWPLVALASVLVGGGALLWYRASRRSREPAGSG